MANPAKRLTENISGDFFVDNSCIDCDACRQIAPSTFRDHGDQSSVFHQPETETEVFKALQALVACPTGSIGASRGYDSKPAVDSFPYPVSQNIYFCGFTSESSFGAWSYLITRPPSSGGNVLIDSPRFTRPLVKKIEEMGGIKTILLTHSDDIADHDKFASKFGAVRVMHAGDGAARYGVEWIINGEEPIQLDRDLLVIPTPGHTRGHQVFLYGDSHLFTGDHLAWSPEKNSLTAFRGVSWYSWTEQTRSMEKLLDYEFEWVLPGHGRIHHESKEVMRRHLADCIRWMKSVS